MNLQESLSYSPVELAFGTSGLRGLVTDMTDLECYVNAVGFLRFLKKVDNLPEGAVIYLAGDLRDSTPRIMQVMCSAIQSEGFSVVSGGHIPTPAIAYYALLHSSPCIMVTGSHIPANRNGIKFYKSAGEILKSDEKDMQQFVANARREIYGMAANDSMFDRTGAHRAPPAVPTANDNIAEMFEKRFTDVFAPDCLAGKKIVVYQHSAVGRDMLVSLVESLGATAVPVGRSDIFIPIDTENVTSENKKMFKQFVVENPGTFVLISTDGDSDRPFVIDETGEFHRGDVLGCITAEYLGATFAAVPISANDAVDEFCKEKNIELTHTKIGSPYVIVAMQQASSSNTVGWEVNGGVLTGNDIQLGEGVLKSLPTRDAFLPILCALVSAATNNVQLSDTFAALPARFTGSGLIDNVPENQIEQFRNKGGDLSAMQQLADSVFAATTLGKAQLDITDGLRLLFESGDVIHLRPSGNAPQFRVYTNASSQERADELVEQALDETGFITKLLQQLV